MPAPILIKQIEGARCQIYGLFSTQDGLIRYIGQTTIGVRYRLRQHIGEAMRGGKWPLCKWIRKHLGKGHSIEAVVVMENAIFNYSEIKLIRGYRANGTRLLNATDGGEGFIGYKPSEAARKNMSVAAKKRAQTSEGKQNASKAGKASWIGHIKIKKRHRTHSEAAKEWARNNPERFEKFHTAAPRERSEEQRRKIAEGVKALWRNPEYRKRVTQSAIRSWTPEKREAARQRGLVRKISEEVRQRMTKGSTLSWTPKRRAVARQRQIGKKRSEEQKRRMSAAQIKRRQEEQALCLLPC